MKIKRNGKTPAPTQARRVLRREVDLATRYMFEGTHDQVWRTCRVRDLATGGAGVELSGTNADEARTHRVILELEIAPAVLRFRGEVRHAHNTDNGDVRIGLQFAKLTALEGDLLYSLLEHR